MRVCPRCRSIYATKVQWCGIDNTALVEQPDDPLVGRDLERYRIVEALGGGGMGCVYRASHTFIDREYAIKVLYGDFAGDPKFRERFRREAKSISQIRHPNIVTVEDFGTTAEGLTFLAMEMVHGRTLEKAIETEAPFSPVRAAQLTRQIVAGLGAAHSLGFVHRDVKPSNIMLSTQNGMELVKILDFGAVSMRSVPVDQRLTSVGHIIGTPTYMAPEQSQDPTVGPPADLYAAGVILFEMLTGTPPFVGKGRAEVLIKHIMEEAPKAPPSRGLERIVAALLKKHPEERPQAAPEVIRMIDALGLDLAIVSDPPRSQAALSTAEIPSRRAARVDFHSVPTRAQTPSTDPSHEPEDHDHPTPQDRDMLGYDTFPALSDEPAEWAAWSTDGGTDPLPYVDLSGEGPTTARRQQPIDDDGEFGGPTIPVDSSLDRDSGAQTDPRFAPQISDDLGTTKPVEIPSHLEEAPLPPSSRGIPIRDDGPTQVDFSIMEQLQVQIPRVSTDDMPTGDLRPLIDESLADELMMDESLIPPSIPDDHLSAIDTAKTLSDGDNLRPLSLSANGATVRDMAVPPSESESGVAPTLELNAREDFLEDSEESVSLRARVIPVSESNLAARATGAAPERFRTQALIALVFVLTLVIVTVMLWIGHSKTDRPLVIDDGAQPHVSDSR